MDFIILFTVKLFDDVNTKYTQTHISVTYEAGSIVSISKDFAVYLTAFVNSFGCRLVVKLFRQPLRTFLETMPEILKQVPTYPKYVYAYEHAETVLP